jgi:hypothetical protein
MRVLFAVLCMATLFAGCASDGAGDYAANEAAPQPVLIKVDPPPPMEVPERREVTSDTDWESRTHNKEIEIIEVLNVINPIAVYITKGFELHGSKFSDILNEEWEDTQVQLTGALAIYEDCKQRKAAGEFDKQLFLDLEGAWQMLVKTGVAGVRTKSMVDSELRRAIG